MLNFIRNLFSKPKKPASLPLPEFTSEEYEVDYEQINWEHMSLLLLLGMIMIITMSQLLALLKGRFVAFLPLLAIIQKRILSVQ